MDDFHQRDNWPFVDERDVSPEPALHKEAYGATRWSSSSSEVVGSGYGNEQDARNNRGDAVEHSEADVSPVASSRSSFVEVNGVNISAGAQESRTGDQRQLYHAADHDELYDDTDEDEMIAPPKPSKSLNGNIRHTDSIVSQRSSVTPSSMHSQHRPSSMMKSQPSKTLPRRTTSLAPQTPLNRQRVRYSWQSMPDEEPSRPRIHVIKLVSNTATASAGFPQGEAFGFAISPSGRRIAAYNSSRLYILQSEALPVGISQDYALKRRPLAVEVVDDGNTLAILADQHTVNVYDLEHQLLRRMKTIKLDYATHCIAMSSTGALLAAGYEGGVEIFSLDPNALATDRRAVRSQKMDCLMFSKDGSTLVGTTTRINASSTVVVSVPVFPASASGIPTHEELKEAWCSELLSPENIRNSSHANFMRENREASNDRLFAWNGLQDTFGILKVPDMVYSNLDFPVVIDPPLSTLGGLGAAIHSCPDVDEHGDTVAMVVNDRTVRLYLVPKGVENNDTIVEAHSIDHELDEGYGCPFSEVRWVQSGTSLQAPTFNGSKHVRGRLIVTSPGAVVESDISDELFDVEDLEGGRIIMFDFDPQHAGQPGQTFSLTLGNSPPQVLEEPDLDVAHEIAIVRRRTVNQSKTGTLSQRPVALGRSATSSGNRVEKTYRPVASTATPNPARRSLILLSPEASRSLPDLQEGNEPIDPIDEPYAQNAPRSQASLQRAATNAQRHRFQAIEEKSQEHATVDTSANFIALPEYTEEPNAPLPNRFRAMAGLDAPGAPSATKHATVATTSGDRVSPVSTTPTSARTERPNVDQAFTARTEELRASRTQQPSRDVTPPITPLANRTPSVTFNTVPTRPGTAEPAPFSAQSTSFVSGPQMNARFIQRAYANAAFTPHPASNAARPEARDNSTHSHTGRPYAPRQVSTPLDRIPQSIEHARHAEPWDAISPLPSSPSSPAYGRPPPHGLAHRSSTSQLNETGQFQTARIVDVSPLRAPSSAGSWAPSTMSTNAPSVDMRLPAHMQAFRSAAAAGAGSPAFSPTRQPDHSPFAGVPKPANSTGYAWRAASAPPGPAAGFGRTASISDQSAFTSNSRARSGFFRRSKKPDLLFGPEFASKQPGAERPDSADSDSAVRSTMDAKSMFTVRTRAVMNKCVLM